MLRRSIGAAWVLLASCAVHSPPQTPLYPEISGRGRAPRAGVLQLHITWTEPYCGGAEPDPSELPRPQPWQGSMYLRPAKPDSSGRMAINDLRVPVTDTIRTGPAGDGVIELP